MAFRITFAADDKVSPVSRKIRDNVSGDYERMRVKTAGLHREFGALRNQFLLGAFAIGPVIAGFSKIISESSKLEESVNAVNVVFGTGSKRILEFGQTAVRNIGLATSEFNQLSAVTGALLRDVGLSEAEVAEQTIVLAKRAADLASVFNTNVKDALFAVNAAIRGETEPIRRYAGDITEATLKQHLLSLGIDRTVKSLSEHEKRLLRMDVLLKQTNVAHDDFINTQKNLANQWRIATANIDNVSAKIGKYVERDAGALLIITNSIIGAFQDENSLLGQFIEKLQDAGRTFIRFSPHLKFMFEQMEKLNPQFGPEVQENIRKYGRAMSGDFTVGLKQGIDLVNRLVGPVSELAAATEKLRKETEEIVKALDEENRLLNQQIAYLAALAEIERRRRADQAAGPEGFERQLNKVLKERQEIEMTTTATYGAQRAMVENIGMAQRETLGAVRDVQKEINERMEVQGRAARNAFLNAQGFKNETETISTEMRQVATFSRQVADAFFTAAIHGRNLEQSVTDILKGLAVRGLSAGIASLIPGVSFAQAFLGFKDGGSFHVGGSGGPDSQLVAFRASPGEQVTVTPPGVTNNNQRSTVINIMPPALTALDDQYTLRTRVVPIIEDELRRRGVL